MPPQTMPCPHHERVNERLANAETKASLAKDKVETHEGQINDLYAKHNECRDINTNILERLTAIEENQSTYMKQLGDFIQEFKEMRFNKRLMELEDFSWFRKKMTTLRNNLPWAFFTLILLIILFLLIAQDVSFGKLLKFIRGGPGP